MAFELSINVEICGPDVMAFDMLKWVVREHFAAASRNIEQSTPLSGA